MVSVLCIAHLWMNCSFDNANFLDEISSLTLSDFFPSVSLLSIEEGLLVSPCCSLEIFI